MRVGILGGGQLGKMIADAAAALSLHVLVYDDKPDACAFATHPHICASFEDAEQIENFARWCNVITCEFENIPITTLTLAARTTTCLPMVNAFRIGSNRLQEKACFATLGIPVPPYMAVRSPQDAAAAIAHIGLPLIVKTASGGYDGKGQQICTSQQQLEQWCREANGEAIAEKLIDFDHELAIVIARDAAGETITYPPVSIFQHHGILHLALPRKHHPHADTAVDYATRLADHLNYTGVLALEMFVTSDGTLYGNEFAPRVHNSGHWTMDGCTTNQFSQHLRAITSMPFGAVEITQPTVMINQIGTTLEIEEDANTKQYNYGKAARAGRKLGHINLTFGTNERFGSFVDRIGKLYEQLYRLPLPANFVHILNNQIHQIS